MDKKKIIQIVVIVIAFGASGLVLYNGFFKNSSPAATEVPISGASAGLSTATGAAVVGSQSAQPILPAGNQLDFSVLQSQNLNPPAVNFPQLDPSSDIGIPEAGLITAAKPLGSQ